MYCSRCGKQISDDSKFCQFCGAKVGNSMPSFIKELNNIAPPPIPKSVVQPQQTQQNYVNNNGVQPYTYDQQGNFYNQQTYPQSYSQPLPMNWYKFVIWVQLFLSAAAMVLTGFLYITGLVYGNNSHVYDWYPGTRFADIFYGIVNLLIAPMAVFVRQQLVRFKKNSPMMLLGYYCIQLPVLITYKFLYTLILGRNCFDITVFTTIVATGIMCALSYVYFDKRKAYFNQ